MNTILNEIYALGVAMFIMVAAATSVLSLVIYTQEPIAVENRDKIFLNATGIQETEEPELYGYHIVGMLNNLDNIRQDVEMIKINDSEIFRIDHVFKANLEDNINFLVYKTKLDLMFFNKIISMEVKEFGDSTKTPYIHYIIEED